MSKDELLDFRISSIINSAEDVMFQKFDDLHRQGHNDGDIINYLRKQGYTDLVDSYAEWAEIDLREDDNTTLNPVVPDPADASSYVALEEQLKGVARIRAAHAEHFPEHPLPSDRSSLQYEIDQLEKEYIGKYHNDPLFHAQAHVVGNLLDQLESVHQVGDHKRVGFLIVALLNKGVQS